MKSIKQEYCTEFGYSSFNKYNETDYSKWLEKKLIEAKKQIKRKSDTNDIYRKE